MSKLFYCIIKGTLILTAIFLLLIGYWAFFPREVLIIKEPNAVRLDKNIYHKGDRITYTLDYCKKVNIPGTILRSLVDGIRINYVAYYNNLGVGCGVISNADLVIPDFVTAGTYHIEATAEYQVNPIRKVLHNWRSVDFQVVD
jgi:hypothetical protein